MSSNIQTVFKKIARWGLFLFGLSCVIPMPSELGGALWSSWQSVVVSIGAGLLAIDMAFLIFTTARRRMGYITFEIMLYLLHLGNLTFAVVRVLSEQQKISWPHLILGVSLIFIALIVVLFDAAGAARRRSEPA